MLKLEKKQTILSYTGQINYDNIGALLAQLKQKMDELGFNIGTYKKVLAVMVECLENIYKYIDNVEVVSSLFESHPPNFTLSYINNEFLLLAGNLVINNDIINLKTRIDKVNGLNYIKLKKLYKKIITNGHFTKKGGAGLGFIEMVKTTGRRIDYEFENINPDYSFFNIKLIIPV